MKVTVTYELPDTIICDVIEGLQEGYISYWGEITPRTDKTAFIRNLEDGVKYVITPTTIREGIRKILSNLVEIDPNIREYILTDNLDADAIDCIVQVGLFGELVYG